MARRTGISDYTAGASPAGKREIVAALQAKGRTVMMVGDGINDAPALTEAAVGVAIGRGTDIAMESADMVLTRNDLMLLPWLVDLARRTYRIIRQNIFWSFFYNIVAVPLRDGKTCSGCRVSLPISDASRIRTEPPDAVVQCPRCTRILLR